MCHPVHVFEYLNGHHQVIAIAPTIGLLRSELFPTEIRATASGIIWAMGDLTAMVNLKLFPMAVASFGFHSVMYFYAAITGLMVTWGILTIENTDRLSLTEIQDKQNNNKTEMSAISNRDKDDRKVVCTNYQALGQTTNLKFVTRPSK